MNSAAQNSPVRLLKVAKDAWAGPVGSGIVVTRERRYLGRVAGRPKSETTYTVSVHGVVKGEAGGMLGVQKVLAS